MRLTIRLLGTEVLHVSTEAGDAAADGAGDVTSYPVPFAGFTPGVRWDADVVEP